jgi:hypothetical protein
MAVFWDVALCSQVELYRHFRDTSYLQVMMEAVSTSETSITFYEISRRNIPEDINLQGTSLPTFQERT